MNKFKVLLATLFAVIAVTSYALIGYAPYSNYSTTGTALGGSALTNYAVIGAYSYNNGTPVVTYLNATAATNNSGIITYTCTNQTTATAASTNVRTNQVVSTNGFSSGTVVVVRHISNDTYEKLLCLAPLNPTNITFASDPVTPLASGDIIYQQSTNAYLTTVTNNGSTGNSAWTINLLGPGIVSGQRGKPLLLDFISGAGTNGVIRAVNARFEP